MKATISALLFLCVFTLQSFAGVNEDLVAAIQEKNTAKLKSAIEGGADANFEFEHYLLWQLNRTKFSKFTPLMLASSMGYSEGVLHLLHAGAKANKMANGGVGVYFEKFPVQSVKSVTALHLAAGNGHVEAVKLLIQAKAHKKLVMMAIKAKTSSAAKKYVAFVNGVANFTPKKWAKDNGHENVVALWKESKKAAWAKEGLPPLK